MVFILYFVLYCVLCCFGVINDDDDNRASRADFTAKYDISLPQIAAIFEINAILNFRAANVVFQKE